MKGYTIPATWTDGSTVNYTKYDEEHLFAAGNYYEDVCFYISIFQGQNWGVMPCQNPVGHLWICKMYRGNVFVCVYMQ